MMRETMLQVGAATTAAELWAAVDEVFSSQTRARAVNTRIALATMKKGAMTASEYMAKMKALADEMAAAGKSLGAEELVLYTLTGLDMEYNPLVTSMLARKDPIPYSELLSQMLSFESRLDLLQQGSGGSQTSVNSASHGGGRTSGNRGSGCGVASQEKDVVAASARVDVDVARPALVDRSHTIMDSVRCASRKGTTLSHIGIVSMLTMSRMRRMLTPLSTSMGQITVGTLIQVQRIILPASSTN
jgi:hypothetical protein